jgi:hypothetical protein
VGLAAVPAMSMARQGALSSPAGRARSCAGTDLEAGHPVGRADGSQRRVEANGPRDRAAPRRRNDVGYHGGRLGRSRRLGASGRARPPRVDGGALSGRPSGRRRVARSSATISALPSSRRDGRQAVVHRSSPRLSASGDGGMAVRHQAAGGLVAGISCVSTRSVGARMNTSHIMSGCCWLPLMKPITRRPVACSITASKRSRISSWNSMRC